MLGLLGTVLGGTPIAVLLFASFWLTLLLRSAASCL